MKTCENCCYWMLGKNTQTVVIFGSCFRYPKNECKDSGDYCGEWKGIKILTCEDCLHYDDDGDVIKGDCGLKKTIAYACEKMCDKGIEFNENN